VLLRFQKFCRRSVSVGFVRKTAVFGWISVLIINALQTSLCLRSYGMTTFIMPSSNGKQLSPFFFSPKNPLFYNKVQTYYRILVSKWLKSQKTKKRPAYEPRYRTSAIMHSKQKSYEQTINVGLQLLKNIHLSKNLGFCDKRFWGKPRFRWRFQLP